MPFRTMVPSGILRWFERLLRDFGRFWIYFGAMQKLSIQSYYLSATFSAQVRTGCG
jgi:hypothetical protein